MVWVALSMTILEMPNDEPGGPVEGMIVTAQVIATAKAGRQHTNLCIYVSLTFPASLLVSSRSIRTHGPNVSFIIIHSHVPVTMMVILLCTVVSCQATKVLTVCSFYAPQQW